MTRREWLATLTGCLTVALVATMIIAAGRSAETAASPLEPVGSWKAVLVVGAVGAFAAYIACLLLLRRSGSLVAIVALAVAVQLLPLFGPTLLSRDVYTYWAYGRIGAVHAANPYSRAPADWPDDPATRAMGGSWREQPSLYGPVFTIVSSGVARVAGESPRRASLLFRAIASFSIIAIVLLAALLARNRAFAAAFVGLNPLVALHFGGGGHNDALMMALVLGALALHRSRHETWSGLAWALSALVKWISLAFLALVVVGDRHRRGQRLLSWSTLWLLGLSLAATALYGIAWLSAAERLSAQARRTSSIGLSGWLGDLGLSHRPTVVVIGLLTIGVSVWLLARAWRGDVRLGLAGVLLAALQGWLNPWYAIWGLALAAPEEDRVARVLAVALSAFLLRDAIPL